MVSDYFPEYTLVGLLTNLAVDPTNRRSGVGSDLCECCELGCAQWALPAVILQVEEPNRSARAFYKAVGFEEIFREDDATALRVRPGAATLASKLLLTDSDGLLEEVRLTVVTMANEICATSGGRDAG